MRWEGNESETAIMISPREPVSAMNLIFRRNDFIIRDRRKEPGLCDDKDVKRVAYMMD